MNTLSLWYDVDIFYTNEQLRSYTFTGHVKRYEKIDNILRAIKSAVGVTLPWKERKSGYQNEVSKNRNEFELIPV